MFIVTEQTPNPDAMKFEPHAQLTAGGAFAFHRADFDSSQSPLAARLFALADVLAVYVAPTFVTVTRSPMGRAWPALRLAAIAAIADHLESGAHAVAADVAGQEPASPSIVTVDEIEAEIRSVLHLWVRPGVARDGGDILFDRFDPQTGVLRIRMQGACGGCPSSRLTLKAGVERIVRRYVPEVLAVEDAADDAPATPPSSRLKGWLANLPPRAGPAPRPIFTYGSPERSNGPDPPKQAVKS